MRLTDARADFQGAYTTLRKSTRYIVVHHAAALYPTERGIDDVRSIARYHTINRGWPGIGYHEVIAERVNGGPLEAFILSNPDLQRAHILNRNHECFGICAATNFGAAVPEQKWIDALALRLAAALRRYPDAQIVGHREIAVRGGETACPGAAWASWKPELLAAVARLTADTPVAPPEPRYDADSRVMGTPLGTAAQARAWLTQRSKKYDPTSIATIVAEYERVGSAVGVDWFLAIAQCAHETAHLSAAMAARPIRNPAGIGVTGASSTTPRPGYVWDADRNLYRAAVTFRAWTAREAGDSVSSVDAHIGRLVAYALPPGHRFGPSQALADRALTVRSLPLTCHGSAPTLRTLGRVHNPADPCGWASPGDGYGAAIANLANRMRGLS